ncbi:hypothetical protein HN51_001762 [Arachis hypogaea]|uniref:uncharacterized protein n=1 Tax=Arachis hypogaea TaxID=3818 RepID=UPI003B2204DE
MRREALVNNVPDDIPRDQWACFVNYRLKPSTVELCMKNKENRNKQIIPHTCGSKSNSRRRHEMHLKTGKKPSRGMMYIETHKRKDGSFVNNEALTIVEQIELNMTQSNTQFECPLMMLLVKFWGLNTLGEFIAWAWEQRLQIPLGM